MPRYVRVSAINVFTVYLNIIHYYRLSCQRRSGVLNIFGPGDPTGGEVNKIPGAASVGLIQSIH